MIRSCTVFVLAVTQVVSGYNIYPVGPYSGSIREGPYIHPYQEKIPRHCWHSPDGISTYECCPIPNLYSEEVMDACEIKKYVEDPKAPRPKRKGPPDCKEGLCLMNKTNLLNDNKTVNLERLRIHLDNWIKKYPEFGDAMLIAKDKCVREKGALISPTKICEPDSIFFCLSGLILWNCKLREDLHSCVALKEHMDECRPYYETPEDQQRVLI